MAETEDKRVVKVYCDTGAFRKELKDLEAAGQVTLVMFPYENRNRRIADVGVPSQMTWKDLKNFTWDTLPGTWNDYTGSEKYSSIAAIIGKQNRGDTMHLDSAYKSGCLCFFTRDKSNIYAKKTELESLLGIKIYHPDTDWIEFLVSITNPSSG